MTRYLTKKDIQTNFCSHYLNYWNKPTTASNNIVVCVTSLTSYLIKTRNLPAMETAIHKHPFLRQSSEGCKSQGKRVRHIQPDLVLKYICLNFELNTFRKKLNYGETLLNVEFY